ncbi:MAG TPA: cytochrome c3 family protein [Anaeromyxobacteraceae bacterium]|nr:cytochrome c3 family protein [Anaeromyxobacteraceae bacterium]
MFAVSLGACAPRPARVVWPRTPPPIVRLASQRAASEEMPVLPERNEEGPRVVVHEPFRDGQCGSCHANGKGGGVLLVSADRLCEKCHREIAARRRAHAPAAGSCLECHARHVSMTEGLLAAQSEAKLCARCHDPGSRKLARAHQGYPVDRSRCTRCHDPHGGAGEGSLLARLHKPASRCSSCHVAATEKEPLALLHSERETCGRCHPDADPNREAAYEHAPFGAGCSSCHSPHGSDRPHLLRKAQKDLCLGCHDEMGETLARPFAHSPAAAGRCTACHSPHGADRRGLLVASAPALCIGCHARWHETSGAVRAPARDSEAKCLYCHDPHGSGRPAMLRHERTIANAG